MESFEKRKRERKKQEQRKEKAARKLAGLPPSGPSEEDYFADPGAEPKATPADGEPADSNNPDQAESPPAIEGREGS